MINAQPTPNADASKDIGATDLHARPQNALRMMRAAYTIVRPVGALCALFGALALAGYLFGMEFLYRPIEGGPATNPLTATAMTLLGLGLVLSSIRLPSFPKIALTSVVLALTVCRLVDVYGGSELARAVTPFQGMVDAQLAMGKSNSMGANSAWMLMLLSVAQLANAMRLSRTAQAVAFAALALPMVSYIGYAYGIDRFYGQMSLITASVGFFLAVATLGSTALRGALRALLSPYIGGRIARAQLVLGYLVPFVLGLLLINVVTHSGPDSLFGIFGMFVVAIMWFVTGLVAASAMVQERIDHKRRLAERALAVAALNDPLTKLPNRRQFFAVAERELEHAHRLGAGDSGVWLLMLDIDHFKRINDTAGHATGDDVLRAVGGALRKSVRAMDLVARVGGEEFAVLLPGASEQGALRVAENIRHTVETLDIDGWTADHGPVTISVGCASAMVASGLEEALSTADRALYQAKEQGRNRVVAAWQMAAVA